MTNFVSGQFLLLIKVTDTGFLMFHVVMKPWISGKSCEILKNIQNTTNYTRNFAKDIPPQLFETYIIFELTLVFGAVY